MNVFGGQMALCRRLASPRIKQRELAELLHKDPSVISKLESDDDRIRSTVANLDITDIKLIEKIFRERSVPDQEINKFVELWKIQSSEGADSDYSDSLLVSLQQAFKELSADDAEALREEITSSRYFWLEFKFITDQFKKGRLEYGQAEDKIARLLNDQDFYGGKRLQSRLLLYRGIYRGYQGKLAGAIADFNQALIINDTDPKIRARTYMELGDLYRRLDASKWDEAIKHYEEAERILVPIEGINISSIIKRKMASVCSFAGKARESLKLSDESLNIARKAGNSENERKAKEHKAWAQGILGYLDDALELEKDALQLGIRMKLHPKELAKSYRYLGDYFFQCGFFKNAYDNYLLSLEEIEKTQKDMVRVKNEKEVILRGWVMLGVGSTLINIIERRPGGQKALAEAFDIAIDLEDKLAIGLCHMRFGEFFLQEDNLEKAFQQFELSRKAFAVSGLSAIEIEGVETANPYYLTQLYLDLVDYYCKIMEYNNATNFVNEAIRLSEAFGYKGLHVEARLKFPQIYLTFETKISKENFQRIYDAVIHEAYDVSILLLNKVLKNILSQLRKLAKNNSDDAIIIAQEIYSSWSDSLSIKSAEKPEFVFIPEWLSQINEEVSRWETLRNSSF